MTIDFKNGIDKATFVSDTDFVVEDVKTENVRNLRVFVNGTMIYHKNGFRIKNEDEVKIKLFIVDILKKSVVYLHVYNPNKIYESSEVPEKVYDEKEKFEEIKID